MCELLIDLGARYTALGAFTFVGKYSILYLSADADVTCTKSSILTEGQLKLMENEINYKKLNSFK